MTQQLELLAPAGTPQILKSVILAGADAAYIGGNRFGARAYAKNFNDEELLWAIDFAHLHGKKVYLTVNTLLKERELEEQLYEFLLPCYEQGLDAVIVQDFGVMQFVRRNFKGLAIHASTQMTVLGTEGVRFLEKEGASRIVLGRELSLEEIAAIHQAVPVELEVFVHGALCYCYSGQCLFSSLIGGRSGNRGRCAQPCRLPYQVREKGAQLGQRQQAYPLSPRDLCAVSLLPQLAKSGVFSFKIEGRMKQAEYAAGVVSVYRKYLDRYLASGREGDTVSKEDKKKLLNFGNRSGFTEGYFGQWNGPDMITFDKPGHEKGESADRKEVGAAAKAREKLLVWGILSVKREKPVELTLEYQDCRVTVTGETAVPAAKRSVTDAELMSKLNKTGNTPFAFDTLEIELEDGLFLPMGAVNELRRQAFGRLQEQFLSGYRRKAGSPPEVRYDGNLKKYKDKTVRVTASAETKEQISVLLETPLVSEIYVDSSVFSRNDMLSGMQEVYQKAKKSEKQIYYILPSVFRNHTAVFYASILQKLNLAADGFLAKSYDALGFLLEHGIQAHQIRIDFNLNTWSAESKRAFYSLGIAGDTVPLELNRKEIRARVNLGSEMLIYGYLPLMISAQCIRRNTAACTHIPGMQELCDRYGVIFPVKNHCNECYNVIYNSRPLCLFPFVGELKGVGIRRVRLSFTVESGAQAKQILALLGHALDTGTGVEEIREGLSKEFTYGHYKRGVE